MTPDDDPIETDLEAANGLIEELHDQVDRLLAERAVLRREYNVRYPDHSTVYMSGEKAYIYSASYPTLRQAELLREILQRRHPDEDGIQIVSRTVSEWKER